ncbi:MAG: hypothetical protein JSC085_000181 [Candidatus Tokpelaia sp. JSC085]|nr:MAG: hypothetical protein JSC085_000181 [Candidatus Tokpelaia sp. JSC085]
MDTRVLLSLSDARPLYKLNRFDSFIQQSRAKGIKKNVANPPLIKTFTPVDKIMLIYFFSREFQ